MSMLNNQTAAVFSHENLTETQEFSNLYKEQSRSNKSFTLHAPPSARSFLHFDDQDAYNKAPQNQKNYNDINVKRLTNNKALNRHILG